ncbi:putative multidrug resistance protein NorM [Halobacillus andaensis]|uniref:Probable multidrug resistance protein NorM n=1 Tax=Halobacillus andaensis TaxID=1176239 RepID=A0A917B2E9_HALAA|nr:MATE family efflux transporter [Halobacillus andaensis]MBP2004213.1 MATE family multidrug resistance protein [Halobacillus andaensis]GGF16675.1 putative multidrug resistance protein NorM [Halobacillus andaensis]
MYETKTLREKIQLFLIILLPILVTQIGMYLMNFFDTIMAGQSGPDQLAGVAIGSNIWLPIFTGLNGIMMAISPIVAQQKGARQEKEISSSVKQGVYLSIAVAIAIGIIGFLLLDPILNLFSIEEEVRYVAKYYLITLGFGIIPLFVFNLLRSFIDALGQTKISMGIILLTLPTNILFNYVFIFGKWGAPALGGIGAGVASALTYWVSCSMIVLVIHKMYPLRVYGIFSTWITPSLRSWYEQLRIGIPIGFAIFFETSIFAAVTFFMTAYDTYTIAAHQAAINFASLVYMMPLSIAFALTIAVGFEVGAKRYEEARTYSYLGISMAVGMSVLAGLILYIFDDSVARLYSSNEEVIELTKSFIFYAIFFQLSDGFGAPLQGILRGYKDVNITLVMAFVSYWVIGLPSGYLMANYTDLGPYGYWMSLIIGLTAGAITLWFRMVQLQRTNIRSYAK